MKNAVLTSNAAAFERGAMETETIQKNGARLKSLMSRGNFLATLCGALFAASLIFIGCGKDDDDDKLVASPFDGVITATVEKGEAYNAHNSKVTTVAAQVRNNNGGREEFASGTYANGGFTLTLPATPDSKYLSPIEEIVDEGKGIKISNKTAKVVELDLISNRIIAYDDNTDYYGDRLACGMVDKNSKTVVEFWYADKDVTMTALENEDGYKFICSVSLKKGWNRVYMTETETKIEATTTPVSGVKWYFEYDFKVLGGSAAPAQKVQAHSGAKRSFFKK